MTASTQETPSGAGTGTDTMARILVVDDVKFISKMLAAMFEEKGHEVITAADGVEAVRRTGEEKPDLVLLDISMPKMDGLEVARTLRSDPATRHIPLMMVTSRNDRESITAAHQAGVDEYLVKPFEPANLLAKVSKLLGDYRMNFSVVDTHGIPLVTALSSEIAGPVVRDLTWALVSAGGEGNRPLILDLSKVNKVDSTVGDRIVQFEVRFRKANGRLVIVAPGKGIGTRLLLEKLNLYAPILPDRASALQTARSSAQETRSTSG
jgi:CheY-like chemotaxis protein